MGKIDHVDYDSLDKAKNAFIAAGRRTLKFAKKYGFVPDSTLGGSANVFQLDISKFLKKGARNLHITLLPEGLGTADDARPDDLSSKELVKFWHNIGIKTVAVMTNDAASSGMQPVLISLYLPSSEPEIVFSKEFMKGFLDGFVEGCKTVGCVYFSGETPQLKNKIVKGKLDIAGALFGIMPTGVKPISSANLKAGDTIVFVESSGPHENGFTSLRKLAEELKNGYRTKLPSGKEYWSAANAPSVLYTPLIQDILASGIHPTNVEPISGHGWQKLMRPKKNFKYVIENLLPVPEIFKFVEKQLGLQPAEMIKIFNYGVGYAIFTRKESEAKKVVALAKKHGLKAVIAGHVEQSERREVVVPEFNVTLGSENFTLSK
jgi:phosphoribosylformylglycinamidine cyclo-ligase